MKKSEIASWIVYLLMVVFAVIMGIFIIKDAMENKGCAPDNMNQHLFVIINILIALVFNILMLEVLHTLGGLIGGYSIVSVNIVGLCFGRNEKGGHLSIRDFDGLTGETKLAPKKEKLSLKPYIWLPLFGYAIELASCIVLYTNLVDNSLSNNRWLAVSALVFIVASSMIALYNLTPIRLDAMTDGYRMVLISNKTNLEAYNEYLRVENLLRLGKEVEELKVFEDITEFTANINVFAAYNLLKEDKFKEAEEIIDKTLADTKKLEPYTIYSLISHKMYLALMNRDVDECKAIYDKIADDKARRYIANSSTAECARAYMLISGLIEKSEGEFNYALARKQKALKKTPKANVEIEEKLYQGATNKVYEAHPNWNKEKVAA